MSESTPQPGESEKEKRAEAQRDLIRAYKRFFSTEDGQRILADLKGKYHWGDDAYTFGISGSDLAYKLGTHSPLRYIVKMEEMVLAPLGKPPAKRTAKSGPAPRT